MEPSNEMEAHEFLHIFYEIDKDKSGVIDRNELKNYIAMRNYSASFIQKYLKVFDSDDDGRITFLEYQNGLRRMPIAFTVYNKWHCLFERLDRNHDGYITLAEFERLVKESGAQNCMHLQQLREFIQEMDVDQDGKLNYTELLQFLLQDQTH